MKKTGSVTPSSSFLAKRMAQHIPKEATFVLEFGGGTGALTNAILKQLGPETQLLVFESNPLFVEKLKQIKDTRLMVIEGDAENAATHITKEKHGQIDAIVSSIPIANLKKDSVTTILQKWKSLLKMNGVCIQYQYSLLTQNIFKQVFKNIQVSFEPRNIPPAFIYVSKKETPQ